MRSRYEQMKTAGEILPPCGSLKNKNFHVMKYELAIKLMKELERTPEQSRRALSKKCSVSLGSIHYCLNALIDKGYVKAQNFKNAQNKLAYSYIVTPAGLKLKKEITIAFLKRKQAEYELLQTEIKLLEKDVEDWLGSTAEITSND